MLVNPTAGKPENHVWGREFTIIDREGIPPDRYELQMLYGIAEAEQRRVLEVGLPLRISAPYGPTRFSYLMRRLAERPANLTFFLRGALNR